VGQEAYLSALGAEGAGRAGVRNIYHRTNSLDNHPAVSPRPVNGGWRRLASRVIGATFARRLT